ncbi:hypothetical protein [Mesorhizobium sp. ANAO-SY3R2]|uniref:hypothetical protein n=1 Tax=Pseudomonadota TaxID=1224 RepID=UPI003672823F
MLPDDLILEKTDFGRAELSHQGQGLSHGSRRVLILVDGVRRVADIKAALGQTADAVATLEVLLAQRYIAAHAAPDTSAATSGHDTEKFTRVKTYLTDFVNGLFGSDGQELVQEISRCTTVPQLRAYGDVCVDTVASFAGKKKADEFAKQLKAM